MQRTESISNYITYNSESSILGYGVGKVPGFMRERNQELESSETQIAPAKLLHTFPSQQLN